jgi:hypothetical protein
MLSHHLKGQTAFIPSLKFMLTFSMTMTSGLGSLSFAQSNPVVSVNNECTDSGGLGEQCTLGGMECSNNQFARHCVIEGENTRGQCFVGCEGEGASGEPNLCSFGEQCVSHPDGYYCQPVPFQMDLNLLDQCIAYWLEGGEPAWSRNRCSLEANLNRLLDQNQDYRFDIFDLDLCVLAFLDRPDPPIALNCTTDQDCGLGLYCDPDTQGCTRECGLIPSREVSISDLDRQCVGALKTCNYERGRCESLSVEAVSDLTCEIDRNCPSGAYCFLGQCAPHCYRAIDCPSSEWYCTDVNKCRVLPDPATDQQSFSFDPSLYAVRFARKRLDLDGIQTRDESPLAVMDLITRQQVKSNPSVSFGYRLLVDYAIKEDLRCLAPFPEDCEDGGDRDTSVDPTPADCYERVDDCIVDSQTESWIRLISPFGTVSATGDPSLKIELEEAIADRLSPGKYRARIKAVYDNGDSDELTVYYNKKSPSGEYAGSYKVHYQNSRYSLSGLTPINLKFKIDLSDQTTSWNALLISQGIDPDIRDIASGQKVYAYLDGADSISFASANLNRTDHKIPFMGVYYPERGLMRLVGRSVIEDDYIESESSADTDGVVAKNLFARNIERQVELFGPFDDKTGNFYGMYSELIKGMTPKDITLRGSFSLKQVIADSTGLSQTVRDGFALTSRAVASATFDSLTDIRSEIDRQITLYCHGGENQTFTQKSNYSTYLNNVREFCDPDSSTRRTCETPIFSNLITFSDLIGEALGSLGANADSSYLSVYDFLRDRIQLCPEDQTCSTNNDCIEGYECNTARSLCVRRSEDISATATRNFYIVDEACSSSDLECGTNEYCDQVHSVCVSTPSTGSCSANSDCEVGQICQQIGDNSGTYGLKCIQDLSNYLCLDIPNNAYIATLKNDTSNISADVRSLLSQANITYAELLTMLPNSITSAHKLCINADVPSEFQGYSNYEGGDTALCVSENNARCGLALYQKALLGSTSEPNAWVETSEFATNIASVFGISQEQGDSCQSDENCPIEFECHRANINDAQGICRRRADPNLPLFCDDTIDISGCETDLDEDGVRDDIEKVHFTLKEHNRFWSHLVQALKFQGDSHLSDAFMTLYRNQENPFTEGAATVYKREQQAVALSKFDQIISLLTSSPMMKILYDWPIDAYLQRGNDWLELMQTVASDRMETLAAMVDLDRRVFLKRSLSPKFNILQNILQQEYLFQAYLLHLQIEWQSQPGFLVNYEGRSEQLFREGQQIINQVNIARNELGLFDQQVYFESARTRESERSNWHHYLDILTGQSGDGGLLAEARTMVTEAVREMKTSLSDLDALEEKVFAARREISGYIAEQCGPTASELQATMGEGTFTDQNADGKVDYCDYLLNRYTNDQLIKDIRDCKLYNSDESVRDAACTRLNAVGTDVADSFTYTCDKEAPDGATYTTANDDYGTAGIQCKDVVTTFVNSTNAILDGTGDDPLTAPPRCDLNRFGDYAVNLAGRTRMCVGGQMGSKIQEKRLLEFQREQVIGSVETLLKRFTQKYGIGAELHRKCREGEEGDFGSCYSPRHNLFIAQKVVAATKSIADGVIMGLEIPKKILDGVFEGIECEIVAGLAVGTDCPQGILGSAIVAGGATGMGIAKLVAYAAKELADFSLDVRSGVLEARGDQAEIRHEIMEMVREVDDLITEFQTLTMQIFNANMEIDDLRYQIGANYATYQDDVRFIVDHLVGRQQGNLLRGRRLAIESDGKFREVLQYAYRMYMAFIHQYNISPNDAAGLRSRLVNSATLDDLERFIDELTQYELEYCGREGIDCDTLNNIEVLRFSVRDRLFPGLKDIVDARSGRVVTIGEQFNNIITSPPYYKQAVLNQRPVEMIELLFSTPLTMQEFGPDGPNWMINPLECNHLLATAEDVNDPHPGNVAVNIVGQNLGDDSLPIRYELRRGATDLIRSCHPESLIEEVGLPPVSQYTIQPFTIGYAPQSNEAQRSTPTTFATRSGQMRSCINSEEMAGSLASGAECWRFFARGRSLSANGWQLRIPILIDDANTDSAWVIGRNLPRDQRPIIEDIVVYLRYHSRPTSDN